jgi:hypothetical protein
MLRFMFSFLSVLSLIESPIFDLVCSLSFLEFLIGLILKVFLDDAIDGALLDREEDEMSSD